jgi:hypothetical protein
MTLQMAKKWIKNYAKILAWINISTDLPCKSIANTISI